MNEASDNQLSLDRCCIHTITTKPWPLELAVEKYQAAGIGGISVWRDALEGWDNKKAGDRIRAHHLEIVSLVRGGFFPAGTAKERGAAIDENIRIVEEAAELGAPLVVLVCGAYPGQSLEESRAQIQAGIEAVLPRAEELQVRLGIEPLHPMYADTRSAVNTLRQANDMAEAIDSPWAGVVIDVYHLWWEAQLQQEVERCGVQNNLFAFHVCDWKNPTEDMLLDRGLMGEGCIPVRQIREWVESTGFSDLIEVEIFSKKYWEMDQDNFFKMITKAFIENT